MKDTRFWVAPSTRRTLPSWPRFLALQILGILALVVRMFSAQWRYRRGQGIDKPQQIVIIEPFGMGDVLALQPLVRSWCEAGHPVVVAVREEWQPLLEPHRNLILKDLRPAWAATEGREKCHGVFFGKRCLSATARQLRPYTRGARGIDVRGDIRSILLLYLAGCREVQTLRTYHSASDSPVLPGAALRLPVDATLERWRASAVFAPEGAKLSPPTVEHLRGSEMADSSAGPESGKDENPLIACVPLTPWDGKRWQPASWRVVAEGLQQRGMKPVALCGPGETAAAMHESGGHMPVVECKHVPEWVRQMEKMAGVISVNTGPMHIAAALGLPLVVIEGSSRLPLWAPASTSARVIHHQDEVTCAPCHQTGKAAEKCGKVCMELVRPEEILAAFDDLQERVNGTSGEGRLSRRPRARLHLPLPSDLPLPTH